MPTEIVVAPDECRLAGEGDVLLARHLAADWAVALHHPEMRAGALVRFSGPPDAALGRACLAVRSLAGRQHGWRAYVMGGAIAPGDEQAARLARSSRLAIQARLWREGVLLKGEDPGGRRARTIYFHPAAGRLIVRSSGALAPSVPQTALLCPLAS